MGVTIEEAARHLGVSKTVIRGRIKRGEIEARKEPFAGGFRYVLDMDIAEEPKVALEDRREGWEYLVVDFRRRRKARRDLVSPVYKEGEWEAYDAARGRWMSSRRWWPNQLVMLGEQGWELLAAVPMAGGSDAGYGYGYREDVEDTEELSFYFKRPISKERVF